MLKLTHLQQSRISQFSGGGPPEPPYSRGGEGRDEREGKGKGRIGKGGTGKAEEGRNGGGEGAGGALDMGSAPLETSSGSAPVVLWKKFGDTLSRFDTIHRDKRIDLV